MNKKEKSRKGDSGSLSDIRIVKPFDTYKYEKEY